MPQLSLYLDEQTMNALRMRAARSDSSLSQYVAALVRNDLKSKLPDNFLRLYGSLDDESFTAPEELDYSQDLPRVSL